MAVDGSRRKKRRKCLCRSNFLDLSGRRRTSPECVMAEGVGFEPTIRFSPYTHFPGARLQPLGHPSSSESDRLGTARNLANGGAQGNTRSSAPAGRLTSPENRPILLKSRGNPPQRGGAESD